MYLTTLISIGEKIKYEALLALPLNRNFLTTSWRGAFYIFRGVVSWKHVSEIHITNIYCSRYCMRGQIAAKHQFCYPAVIFGNPFNNHIM